MTKPVKHPTTLAVLDDVAAERVRQITQEGFDAKHDSIYKKHELENAAVCYALDTPDCWPWDIEWWKPTNHRKNLVKAAALMIAAIERLDLVEGRTHQLPDNEPEPSTIVDEADCIFDEDGEKYILASAYDENIAHLAHHITGMNAKLRQASLLVEGQSEQLDIQGNALAGHHNRLVELSEKLSELTNNAAKLASQPPIAIMSKDLKAGTLELVTYMNHEPQAQCDEGEFFVYGSAQAYPQALRLARAVQLFRNLPALGNAHKIRSSAHFGRLCDSWDDFVAAFPTARMQTDDLSAELLALMGDTKP